MQAMRIAFLEDDPDQADRIVSLLQGAGHVPHLFPRGRALLTNLGLLLAMSVVLVLACTYRWCWRLDFAVYDASLPSRPAPSDVPCGKGFRRSCP
jgi:hypothetical protein